MPGTTALAKAQQAKTEAFNNLWLKRYMATTLLQDQGRMISNIRTPQSYLSKLETAVTEYKKAVSAVIAASEEENIKRGLQGETYYPIGPARPYLKQVT